MSLESMKRENVQAIYPLLPNQEAFWIAHLHADQDPGCLQAIYKFQGPLNQEVFQKALDCVVHQHPMLRATIQPRPDKSPLLVVWKQASPSLQFHDLRRLDKKQQVQCIEEIKSQELSIGIQLQTLLPYGFHVFQNDSEQHELLWTFHHAFIDGWSSSVVIRDLLAQYHRILKGEQPIQCLAKYEDFLAYRKSIDANVQTAFWHRQLSGYRGVPRRIASVGSLGNGQQNLKSIETSLGSESTAALKKLASEYQLTAGSIAAGMWALTLTCFYQETDIAFGTTVSGRSIPIDHARDMVGLFSNVIPLRARISKSDSVASYLPRFRDQQFEIQEYEHTPLAEISSFSKLPRERSLFDTLLVVENYPAFNSDQELRLMGFESGLSTAYPITTCVIPSDDWTIKLLFDEQVVDLDIVNSISSHFRASLKQLPKLIDETLDKLLGSLPNLDLNTDTRTVGIQNSTQNNEMEFGPTCIGSPRNDLELALTMIWERVLGISEVRYDDNFFEIGGNSITATRVLAAIQSEIGETSTPSMLIEYPTIASLAKHLGCSDANSNREVIRFNQCKQGRPLICVHVGFVSGMFFRHLAAYFNDRPVLGTQSRGISRPESMYESVEQAATDFLRQIEGVLADNKINPETSYDFVAYCAGGSVAFEMARQLEKSGRPPGSLTIVDSTLKFSRRKINIAYYRKKHRTFIRWFPRYIRYHLRKRISLPLDSIFRNLMARYAPSQDIRSKYRETVLRDVTMKAHHAYEIGKIKTPMMLVRSSEYCQIPAKDFHLELGKYSYSNHARIEHVDGEHELILLEPTVEQVAERVKKFLKDLSE